jgi:riboflavin synthase
VASGPRPGGAWFEVDAAAETLDRTTVGTWGEGTRVNLERSLRIGDELGGHIVTGHVDGVAEIVSREEVTGGEWGPTARFVLSAPQALMRFVAEKGSVTLDGTSLTVNSVTRDTFSVLIIPHTLAVTTWGGGVRATGSISRSISWPVRGPPCAKRARRVGERPACFGPRTAEGRPRSSADMPR